MVDERRVHPEYGEDVDNMALEHLIYTATKVCIHDFVARREASGSRRPAQRVATEIHLLNDFMRIHRARHHDKELSQEVRLWLELLELVVFISYRHTDTMLLLTSPVDPGSRPWEITDPLLKQRRQHWFSVRRGTSAVPNEEIYVYQTWSGISTRSGLRTLDTLRPLPARRIDSIVFLFLTVSAKIAHSIDHGISEEWADLAAQLMLQAAVESSLAPQGSGSEKNPLIYAFAWGWVPLSYWDEYEERFPDNGVEAETIINEMFEATNLTDGTSDKESGMWQRTRHRYLSVFNMSPASNSSADEMLTAQLRHVIEQFPIHQFEDRLMVFLKGIWSLFRKPVLVQIEEGYIDGLTEEQFQQFKGSVFPPT